MYTQRTRRQTAKTRADEQTNNRNPESRKQSKQNLEWSLRGSLILFGFLESTMFSWLARCIAQVKGQIREYAAILLPQIKNSTFKIFCYKHKIHSTPIFQTNSLCFRIDGSYLSESRIPGWAFAHYNSVNIMLFANRGSCRRSSTQEVELEMASQAIRYAVLHNLSSALFWMDRQFC